MLNYARLLMNLGVGVVLSANLHQNSLDLLRECFFEGVNRFPVKLGAVAANILPEQCSHCLRNASLKCVNI